MTSPHLAPFGSWKSPITANMIATQTIKLSGLQLDGTDLYWLESRPAESGRVVLVRLDSSGTVSDITPEPFNVRTRVHEYGGGAFLASHRTIFFSNFDDQRVYRLDGQSAPAPITPEFALRYADFDEDTGRNCLVCVREDHRQPGGQPANAIVRLGMSWNENGGDILVQGDDFYAYPRVSPDGSCLSWISWNHPNMPWDGTTLWIASFKEDGSLGPAKRVAGGPDESIFQPTWSPDNLLYFASDRTGWWNLYRYMEGHGEPLCPLEAEFGLPLWSLGSRTFTFESPDHIIGTYVEKGKWHLFRLHTTTGERQNLSLPHTWLSAPLVTFDNQIVVLAASPIDDVSIVRIDPVKREFQVVCRSQHSAIDAAYLSRPKHIEFAAAGGGVAYAYYYPPANPGFRAREGEKPPLLLISHGGPTSSTNTALNLDVQFWTSRGFAVVDVDYSGSTGYGRDYRQRLNGQWGVVDVADVVSAARFLVAQGLADRKRLAIRGSSAGGYTTMAALAFYDVFGAGASYFGVSDLALLQRETHKFESRYLENLVGPYPEQEERYRQRSPIYALEGFTCPLIVFQGEDDEVVPTDQAERIVEALADKGIPVAYILFAGEAHGFRRADTVTRSLEAELCFYGRVFGFKPADDLEPLRIRNLD